jgi:acetylglutamate kinase
VLDGDGGTIARLTPDEMDAMTASGTAHSGMIAKLAACRRALDGGVSDIAIVSGRGVKDFAAAAGTRIDTTTAHAGRSS